MDNHETKSDSQESHEASKWDHLGADVPFNSFNAGSTLTNSQLEKNQSIVRDKEAAYFRKLALNAISKDRNEREATELEKFRQKQEAEQNIEFYGADISDVEARSGFNKEFFALEARQRKDERAKEAEEKMSPHERQKAYAKREKRGEVMTFEESQHLEELRQIRDLGSPEDYGRRKESYFRQIQENAKADKRGFKKYLKKHNISAPKTWDDPNYSLDDLGRIATSTDYLKQ